MNIINRIMQRLAGHKANDGEVHQTIVYVGGRPVIFTGEVFDINQADRIDINVAIAMRLILNCIGGLPLSVKVKTVAEGKEVFEDDEGHPANAIINKPNTFHSQREIIVHMVQSLLLTGNAYLILDKFSTDGNAFELWPQLPWMMDVLRDKVSGKATGYVFDPMQRKIFYPFEAIVHARNYHMSDPFKGVNPLRPAQEIIRTDQYAIDYNKQWFENHAVPEIFFKNSNTFPTEEDEKRFLKSLEERHRGSKRQHRAGVLPPGVEPVPIVQSFRDMMYIEGLKLNREQILGYFGVPPSEAGVLEFASYANAMIQKRSWWENTLIPICGIIEEAYNTQLIWRHFDEEHSLKFNYTGVKALQDDRVQLATYLGTLVTAGVMTPNEARKEVGLAPADNNPAADELRSIAPSGFSDNTDDEDLDNEPRGDDEKTFPAPEGQNKAERNRTSPRYKKWQRFDKRVRREERAFAKVMAAYFTKQRDRVITALNSITQNGIFLNSWLFQIDCEFKAGKQDDAENESSKIFNRGTENQILRTDGGQYVRKTVYESGQAAMDELGFGLNFNINNPNVRQSIELLMNRIETINDKSYEKIKQLLQEAYEQGWSAKELEKNIRDTYARWIKGDTVTQARAMTIARTEMASAVNGGTVMGYGQAGIEEKEWLATIDGDTRESHMAADGQKVGINNNFDIGGVALRYPGDPAGPPEETINCRCTVMPVIK
ncbi:MAG: phage portal protein [Patescibacteria group bacterium]|nr:phage portal protein [Patescibacteria group bacterium]